MRFINQKPSAYRPTKEILDRKKRTQEDLDMPSMENWEYAVNPVKEMEIAGRKMKMLDDDGNIYAGEVVRDMMESRKWRPESYTWFGYTKDPNRGVEEVGVPHNSLFRHTALFGVTGYGKSTVMKIMILQWMQAGWGLCFIDPKGDDSQDMLQEMPEHRKDDLVWVEPGSTEREKAVGFNFFDTYAEQGTRKHEEEAGQVTSDFISLLEAESRDWTPEMSGVSRAIVGQLVRAEEDYSPVDFFRILDSQTEREAFLDMYGDELDEMERNYVEDLNPDSIRGLTDTLNDIVSKQATREMIAHDGSALNIGEAIEEGKILLINTSNIDDDHKLICAAFVRRIWSTIKARTDVPQDERTPYFLCVDEFDDVTMNRDNEPDRLKIEKILSKARSLRLSVLIANQQPSQLAETIRESIYGNCDNLFTFNPGDFNDASDLSKGIGDIDTTQLLELGAYKVLGRITIDGDKSDGLLIHTYPPYPPLRKEEEGNKFVEDSIQNYGVERKHGGGGLEQYGVARYQRKKDVKTIEVGGEEIDTRHVLSAIEAESGAFSETKEGKDGWVSADAIEDVFDRHAPSIDFAKVKSDIIRPITGEEIELTEENQEQYYRLTEKGHSKLTTTGEGEIMNRLVSESLKYFSSMGYHIMSPIDTTERLYYSGVAIPPINPVKDANTLDEAQRMYKALKATYPDIENKFKDRTILVSPTESPEEDRLELANSLSGVGNKRCVFVVKNEQDAKNIEDLFVKEPIMMKEAGEKRVYHNSGKEMTSEGGTIPLTKDQTEWVEVDNKIELQSNGEQIATFDSPESLRKESKREDFKYYAVRDEDGDIIVYTSEVDEEELEEDEEGEEDDRELTEEELEEELRDEEGIKVEQFESLEELEQNGYTIIQEPLIPSLIFGSIKAVPDRDEWDILVLPDEGDPFLYGK